MHPMLAVWKAVYLPITGPPDTAVQEDNYGGDGLSDQQP